MITRSLKQRWKASLRTCEHECERVQRENIIFRREHKMGETDDHQGIFTPNMVYREVLGTNRTQELPQFCYGRLIFP